MAHDLLFEPSETIFSTGDRDILTDGHPAIVVSSASADKLTNDIGGFFGALILVLSVKEHYLTEDGQAVALEFRRLKTDRKSKLLKPSAPSSIREAPGQKCWQIR